MLSTALFAVIYVVVLGGLTAAMYVCVWVAAWLTFEPTEPPPVKRKSIGDTWVVPALIVGAVVIAVFVMHAIQRTWLI